MLTIGLTGGIASGKSSVAKWFEEKGVKVFDSDQFVHKLYYNQSVIYKLKKIFAPSYFNTDGSINLKKIADEVFHNKKIRKKLEEIIHPLVLEGIQNQCKDSILKNEKFLILDIPLLFEAGWENIVDEVWVVYVPFEIQVRRLMQRNKLTENQAKLRIFSQMPIEEKVQKANLVIDNSGTWDKTEEQLLNISKEYNICY